jgi:hypothetical protein
MQNYSATLPLCGMMLNSPGDEKNFTRMDVKVAFGAAAERTHHWFPRQAENQGSAGWPNLNELARQCGFATGTC